ncbi:hypothetical protein Poly41_34110 [Novipirellula artificiosorum]|uniref:Uncharacterized protein n=1 Tax=Novipirellula artificiosorum TaxID=2528016 RepID=A0A5C6DL05_9BACT|nr:hypothetical protein Poly41_34110 [Novipirellula artificiosorum]
MVGTGVSRRQELPDWHQTWVIVLRCVHPCSFARCDVPNRTKRESVVIAERKRQLIAGNTQNWRKTARQMFTCFTIATLMGVQGAPIAVDSQMCFS